jgi:O-antigen/teichoic acid export membrane protein
MKISKGISFIEFMQLDKLIPGRLVFSKGVLILLSGSIIAQVIPFLVSPFLSRLFSPSSFAWLALLMAAFNPLSYLVCGRYDVAMMLPPEEKESYGLAYLSWFFSFVVFLLIGVFSLLHFQGLWSSFIPAGWNTILVLLPFMLLCTGIYQPMNYLLQRKEKHRLLSLTKIVQTGLVALLSLVFGLFALPHGLLSAYAIGWLMLALWSVCFFFFSNDLKLPPPSEINLRALAFRYRDFPLFNMPAGVIHALTIALPVFCFNHFFPGDDAGYFAFCRQILIAPVGLIANAFSQVYFEKFATAWREKKSFRPMLPAMYKPLIGFALLILIPVAVFGPFLFALFFGEHWGRAGLFASWQVFASAIALVTLPLSSLIPATGRVKISAAWQWGFFLLSLLPFFLSFSGPEALVLYFSVAEFVAYLVFLLIIFRFAFRENEKKH